MYRKGVSMSEFVICIDSESNPASLIMGKVYRTLSDTEARRITLRYSDLHILIPVLRDKLISFAPVLDLPRNLLEPCFNKRKHSRRLATRYEKTAANCLAMLKLATGRLWPRTDEYST